MTRRPIFVAIATILALGLVVGLAYGAGRSTGTRTTGTQHTQYRAIGSGSMMPGSFTRHGRDVRRAVGFGVAFRTQTRGWMHDWMRDHCCDWRHTGNSGYGRQGSRQGSMTGTVGFRNGPVAYSGDRHQTSSTSRSSTSHSYGGHQDGHSYGGHPDGGWHHDCW